MSDRIVTLTISESAYARPHQIAENTAQPVENVLASRLEEVFDDLASLPPDEQAELDHLLERGDRLTLRKAEAAAILTRRGHQVNPKNFAAPRE